MRMRLWGFCALLCAVVVGQDAIQGVLAPEIAERVQESRTLRQGGSALFDDCAIAVGTAACKSGQKTQARNIAHANARAELVALLNGMHVSATDTLSENTVIGDSAASQAATSQMEITTRLEKLRQSGVRVGGEWLSEDGRTLFVCLFSLVNETAAAVSDGPLPDGIQEWKVDGRWEPLLRSAPGILKGGATLVCDDYGDQYVLAVATCPAEKPFSQRNAMLKAKAAAAALEYSKGTMVADMRYLKESLRSGIDGEGNETDDSEVIIRHLQTRITQGNIRGLQDAGNWFIDGGRRACGAFVVRLSDMSEESFDVPLPDSELSDDVLELNMEDSASAELLRKELARAVVSETDKEVVLEVPEDSPLFTKEENEIVVVDHLQMALPLPPVVNVKQKVIILPQPQRLVSRVCFMPRCSRVVFQRPIVVHSRPRRVYMPCRFYRPPHRGRTVHRRPPKPIVIRRRRSAGGPPPQLSSRPSHPPRIRIRHPLSRPHHAPPRPRRAVPVGPRR